MRRPLSGATGRSRAASSGAASSRARAERDAVLGPLDLETEVRRLAVRVGDRLHDVERERLEHGEVRLDQHPVVEVIARKRPARLVRRALHVDVEVRPAVDRLSAQPPAHALQRVHGAREYTGRSRSMFETAELGRTVSREEFEAQEPQLRLDLLEAQRALARAGVPVIVLLAGADGAGKGETVKRAARVAGPARPRHPRLRPADRRGARAAALVALLAQPAAPRADRHLLRLVVQRAARRARLRPARAAAASSGSSPRSRSSSRCSPRTAR